MAQDQYNLAQANVALMLAPLDSEVMAEFVKQLDAINAAADHSPGFVWRYRSEEGNPTEIRVFGDERILFNVSVWENLEDLQFYVYRGAHSGPFRDRKRWFEPMKPSMVLWWVRQGHIPTAEEAKERLGQLQENGPTPAAFTFKDSFPPPA